MNYYFIGNYEIRGVQQSTVVDCVKYLSDKPVWAVDVETTGRSEWLSRDEAGLSPHLGQVIMLQLGDEYNTWAIDTRCISSDELTMLSDLIKDPYPRKVGHNLKFDIKMLRSTLGFFMENIYDTMVAEMILKCGLQKRGFSLEKLTEIYLGFKYEKSNQLNLFSPPDHVHLTKETRLSFKNQGSKPFTLQQVVYGLKDIEHTIKIYKKQLPLLEKQDLLSTSWLEFMTTVALAEMEYFGFHLDVPAWKKLTIKHSRLKAKYLGLILDCISKEELPEKFYDFQKSLFDDDDPNSLKINLSSSRQVIELCKALNIPTKTKDLKKSRELGEDIFKDSVEEKILRQHVDVHPVVGFYLQYRKYEKAFTTYGTQFLEKHVNPVTGCIHSNYWQILNTGRLASRSPNQQNIPREGKEEKGQLAGFRLCFTAKHENSVLIAADYSSQEIRILADKTGDKAMIDFLNGADPDFHSFTARRMFGLPLDKPVPDDLRTIAKTLGFGIAYGMSEFKLSRDFKVSIEEAKDFIDNFYRSYSALIPYFKKQHEHSFNEGYILVDAFTRRKSYIPEWEEYREYSDAIAKARFTGSKVYGVNWKRFYVVKGKIERMSQNYGIQGQAASMTKLAMVVFRLWVKQYNLDAHLVAQVHDEIVVECNTDQAEQVAEVLKRAMLYAGSVFCQKVAMGSTQKISRTWEH